MRLVSRYTSDYEVIENLKPQMYAKVKMPNILGTHYIVTEDEEWL